MASKYILVYNDITSRIQSGMYPAGSRLPAENLLIQEYGVSRDTLRKALAMLEQDGYIQKARGREALDEEDFSSPELWHIYSALRRRTDAGASIAPAAMSGELSPDELSLLTGIMQKPESAANGARALAEMERAGVIKCVITQNADNLHQRAGSKNVIDIHGNVYINTCEVCGKRFPPEAVADCAGVPRCGVCGGVIRPGILLFGEVPDMHAAMAAIREINRSDLLIAGGTSLKVSSAPRLLDRYRGKLVIVNDEPTPYDARAALVINAPIAEAFSRIWP